MGYSRQEPAGDSSDFTSNFLGARLALENAVYDLISSGWEEDRRRRAYDMSVALTRAAKLAAWWESESLLRRLSSLLDLSLPQVTSIRQEVRDKLIEILNLLKKNSASRSA
jgi:hypothetical protein